MFNMFGHVINLTLPRYFLIVMQSSPISLSKDNHGRRNEGEGDTTLLLILFMNIKSSFFLSDQYEEAEGMMPRTIILVTQ